MPLPNDPPNRADSDSATDADLAVADTNDDAALPLLSPGDAEPTTLPYTAVNVQSAALVLIASRVSLYVLSWASEVLSQCKKKM